MNQAKSKICRIVKLTEKITEQLLVRWIVFETLPQTRFCRTPSPNAQGESAKGKVRLECMLPSRVRQRERVSERDWGKERAIKRER